MKVQKGTQWLIIGSVLGAALGTLGVWAYLRWGSEFLARRKETQQKLPPRRRVQGREALDLGMLVLRLVQQIIRLVRPA